MDVERVLEDSENEVKTYENLTTDLENPNKCLSVEDFPCSHFDGTMDLDATRVDQELNPKFEFSDDLLHIEQEHLNVTPLLGDCCEYLMDMSFAGPAAHLGYDCQTYGSENLGSEAQCRSPLRKNNDDAGRPGETGAVTSLPEARLEQNQQPVDNVTIHELHEAFHFTFGRDTTMKDKFWLKRQLSLGLHDLSQFDSSSRILDKKQLSSDVGTPRVHGEDGLFTGLVEVTNTNYGISDVEDAERTFSTTKRLRKPTRRYIEESSEIKTRCHARKLEPPLKSTLGSLSEARPSGQKHWKNLESMALVCRQDSIGGSGIQVPFVLRVRRGRPRKNCTSLFTDNSKENEEHMIVVPKRTCGPFCGSESGSVNYAARVRTAKGGVRRKHHRSWTLQEVTKLVEGVSRHGVGRWSDIKRLEFSASAYRTSVDLKDKWRNLLKASYAQLQTKKVVEQRRRHTSISIPASILMRVRELAAHPKGRQSVPFQHALPSSIISLPGKKTLMSRGGRTV
ncbi:uncharacterized protein LOC116252641 isoform X1 [Nymphaea colorata]|nr:uncharacterized protein LOC116252641 isoform X1 [Nymphaea colorata]XP_031482907.1 uncharacterized protein LOC116252641 isoform X1 [Nymphaea colorata]